MTNPRNPKLTLKVNGLRIKVNAQNFASQVLSKNTFKIWRKKASDFFDHSGTLRTRLRGYLHETGTNSDRYELVPVWNFCGRLHETGTKLENCTLRAVGFSYASRERNHCEEPFDFPLSMCEVRHNPRDVFDITSSYFAGNHYSAGSPKRSSYTAERKRKRQNKFTNSFYRFKFNLCVLGAGRRITQRN